MSQIYFLDVNLPRNEDTSLYRTLYQVPKVSTIEGSTVHTQCVVGVMCFLLVEEAPIGNFLV